MPGMKVRNIGIEILSDNNSDEDNLAYTELVIPDK
jgi:hypothetical protein